MEEFIEFILELISDGLLNNNASSKRKRQIQRHNSLFSVKPRYKDGYTILSFHKRVVTGFIVSILSLGFLTFSVVSLIQYYDSNAVFKYMGYILGSLMIFAIFLTEAIYSSTWKLKIDYHGLHSHRFKNHNPIRWNEIDFVLASKSDFSDDKLVIETKDKSYKISMVSLGTLIEYLDKHVEPHKYQLIKQYYEIIMGIQKDTSCE